MESSEPISCATNTIEANMINELNTLKSWLSKVGLKQSSDDIGRLIRASVGPVTLEGMPSVALGDISLEDEDSEDE